MTGENVYDEARAAQVRAQVAQWLAAHWKSGADTDRFLADAVDAGWARPSWPADTYGRGLPEPLAKVVTEEFRRAGAPSPQPTENLIQNAIATTVIKDFAGSVRLRGPILRELLTGRFQICLLYSEPGSGSDLAALQTNAQRDGDEWVVNGQKVWTSEARGATYGLLAARTNWDVPKHRGITYFLLPMSQEGVVVRPIRQMTGHAHFNEVFLTDARVSDQLRISPVDGGWKVMQAALAIERMVMGTLHLAEKDAGSSDEEVVHAVSDLVDIAKRRSRSGDFVMRQEIARVHALQRIADWNLERAKGEAGMSIATVLKLARSTVLHDAARIHAQLLGPEAMLVAGGSDEGETANQAAMWQFAHSIGGGTDQIQRNLIAERVLGLPRDHSSDRDIPFREVRKAQAIRRLS